MYREGTEQFFFFLIIIMRRRECNVKLGFHNCSWRTQKIVHAILYIWFMYIPSEFIYRSLIIRYACQKVFWHAFNTRIATQLRCSRNPPNIRNPLIYCANRYFLIFGVSQVQKPYRASTNSFLTFWHWYHYNKIMKRVQLFFQ